MALRCFVFSPDAGTSDVIRQVLTGIDVEGESCPEAVTAGEKIAKESFQLVVIDWDQQPEATALLSSARERKASERPLILAIVSDDTSVPKALQAGANSILRRPILVNQVKDTLTTARDLLRARVESASAAQAAAAAAAAAASAASPSNTQENEPSSDHSLRAGEFLSTAPIAPPGQFETEAAAPISQEAPVAEHALRDLEPLTSDVPPPPPVQEEPRTLEELLRSRGVGRQTGPAEPPKGVGGKPEMLGFDQTPSFSSNSSGASAAPAPAKEHKEPALFSSYTEEPEKPKESSPSRFRLGKGAILAAMLASAAIVLAPQAPWHPGVKALWARGQRSLRTWLNPQPVTTPVAPTAHEDFSRAGDEYKLPVAENIPDATTDPSQIHVVPVVDPTAKKPNNASAAPDQPAVIDTPATTPTDGTQPAPTTAPDSQPPQPAATTLQPSPVVTQPVANPAPAATTLPAPVTSAPPTQSSPNSAVTYTPVAPTPAAANRQPAPYVPPPAPKVPSSLKSQISTMVPDASGNKPPEAAMQSIEPVAVTELTERALLTDQPPLDFPAAAGGQHGTVLLQVLVGRDGTVQDAKFLQGSLAFARAAIDGVKQWKFKPYLMNGRPVSVQTTLTIKFPPQ
jgi:protein TonB